MAVALAALVLIVTGCQTTARVVVEVDRDGSGRVVVDVSLDAEAADAVGDLRRIVAVDDLRDAGWTIDGPTVRADGTSIHLEHPFANVDAANTLFAGLSGPDGPLRDLRLVRTRSTFSQRLDFHGTVDMRGGLDVFADPDLTDALGGTLADVVERSGVRVPTGDDLAVELRVVGTGEKATTARAVLGGAPATIDVHTTTRRTGRIVALIVTVALVVGLVAVVIFGQIRRRRLTRRRRRPVGEITLPPIDD